MEHSARSIGYVLATVANARARAASTLSIAESDCPRRESDDCFRKRGFESQSALIDPELPLDPDGICRKRSLIQRAFLEQNLALADVRPREKLND